MAPMLRAPAAGRGGGRGAGRGVVRGDGRGAGRGRRAGVGRVAGRGDGAGDGLGRGASRGDGAGDGPGHGAGRGDGPGDGLGCGAGRGRVPVVTTTSSDAGRRDHPSSSGSNIGASVSRISLGGDHTTDEPVDEETTRAPRARGLILLTIHSDGYIEPYDEIPKICTRAFKRVDNPGGFTWTLTPEPIRVAYWEEFKKQCTWAEEDDDFIYNHWWSRARRRYRDFVHYMKKPTIDAEDPRSKKPPYITAAIWEQWLAYWDREDVKAKSETAKKCRMSEPEGEGTGQVFHRLGSKSIMQYAHELAVERGVLVKDCMYDAYSRSHIKADGTFTDPKAAKIHGQIEEYIEEERLEGREVTHNEAYLHVVKLDEKKRMFGSGELAKSIASELSTGTSHFHSQAACDDRLSEMQQQLQEEREAREKLAEQTQQLQEALQAQQRLFEQFVSQSRGDADHPPPF